MTVNVVTSAIGDVGVARVAQGAKGQITEGGRSAGYRFGPGRCLRERSRHRHSGCRSRRRSNDCARRSRSVTVEAGQDPAHGPLAGRLMQPGQRIAPHPQVGQGRLGRIVGLLLDRGRRVTAHGHGRTRDQRQSRCRRMPPSTPRLQIGNHREPIHRAQPSRRFQNRLLKPLATDSGDQ